jgi:hypothetical protein
MLCPHCGIGIHFETRFKTSDIGLTLTESRDFGQIVVANFGYCSECKKLIGLLRMSNGGLNRGTKIIFPFHRSGRQLSKVIPTDIVNLFRKAEEVLQISPEASATLSRRILQQVFHEHLSIKKKNLNEEIDEFISKTDIPSYLRESVDGIRATGNYAAHPIKYQNSGEMVDVEDGEAEWSLDTLESLFDFVFVQPKKLEEQREKLNAKNVLAGKPQLKGAASAS